MAAGVSSPFLRPARQSVNQLGLCGAESGGLAHRVCVCERVSLFSRQAGRQAAGGANERRRLGTTTAMMADKSICVLAAAAAAAGAAAARRWRRQVRRRLASLPACLLYCLSFWGNVCCRRCTVVRSLQENKVLIRFLHDASKRH